MDRQFLNNQNLPIRCSANDYRPRPPFGMFFSKELNEKWDKRDKPWDEAWGEERINAQRIADFEMAEAFMGQRISGDLNEL